MTTLVTRGATSPASVLVLLALMSGVVAGTACAGAHRPPPKPSPPIQEVVLLMHWFSTMMPTTSTPPMSPTAPPSPSLIPPAPPCPMGALGCDAPAPPTLDEKYKDAWVPSAAASALQSELGRLLAFLPVADAAKIKPWSVSIDNCSTGRPLIIVCKEPANRIIKVAPVLINSILLQRAAMLVAFQDKLKSWGADPATFDGLYQPIYAGHGMMPDDWNAVLTSWANMYWPAFIGSVDYVIAQQMASLVLSTGGTLSCTDPDVNQDAKAWITSANGGYDTSQLVTVLGDAAGKYDHSTWGYESASDINFVLAAIPANTPAP
jgi:hypothetical protein